MGLVYKRNEIVGFDIEVPRQEDVVFKRKES